MLYDLRQYTCRPGTISKQLALYSELGFATQKRHLGEPLLYAVVETGDVNAYTHVWSYRNAADREERRRALYNDPAWIAYREAGAEKNWQTSQRNMLLKPAPFWLPE